MGTDFNKLRLKYHDNAMMLDKILQEECRLKCAKKLPETLLTPSFRFPSLALAEMCTSEAVAGVHAELVGSGNNVLDMTAGLGIDVFAFAENGCNVTAIELDNKAAECLQWNSSALGLGERISVVNADSLDWLGHCKDTFDVIFIDPARRDSGGRHITIKNCQPDIAGQIDYLLTRAGKVIVKTSPMIDVSAAIKEFEARPTRVTVIGTTRECKEVVFTFEKTSADVRTAVECVTVGHGRYVDQNGSISYADPAVGKFLMQPYPAVMKGVGGVVTGFAKISPMTHLYVSDSYEAQFPGTSYEILEILDFNKRTIRDLKARIKQINVSVRNFPLSAPELVKKLDCKEGGDETLFGVTLNDNTRVLIIAKRV